MKLRRPSPALLIACLALFASLGGVSYGFVTGEIDSRELRNNTIRTQDIRNNDIRGVDIRNSTIKGADVARNTLTGSDVNEARLGKVANADALDGISGESYLGRDTVGPAALSLTGGWTASNPSSPPTFDVDPLGYVHLEGAFTQGVGAGAVLAVLPVGARPIADRQFVVRSDSDGIVELDVDADGDIRPDATLLTTDDSTLDGVTFKAGG